MSNSLPMAINPSISFNQCNFVQIQLNNNHLYFNDFLIEINHKLIESKIALFLGLDEMQVQETAVAIKLDNYIYGRGNCIKGLTLEQVQHLFMTTHNARADKYKPILAELILTQILPLFNATQTQLKPDDFKKDSIMPKSQLININQQKIGNDNVNAVSARELHKFLESKRLFNDWVKPYISENNDYGFIQGTDFIRIHAGVNPTNNVPIVDYAFTVDMAKEVSMLSKTEKGKQARKYFIECERKAHNPQIEQKPTANTKSYIGNASLVRLALKEVHAMKLSPDSKQAAIAHLLHDHAGLPLGLLLPVQYEERLPAEEIGKQLGISANMVGRIVTDLGIRNNPELCEVRRNKSKFSSKEVEQCFYSTAAIEMITERFKGRSSK